MSKTLYVRIQPKQKGVNSFFRCGFKFSGAWQTLEEVDEATAKRLGEEQMLEVSETRPPELEGETPNEADPSGTSTDAQTSGTSATAGTSTPAKPDDPAEVALAILAAVGQLNKDDGSLWTAAGKPKTEAISVITGWPVSAAERDAALAVGE